MEEERQRRLQPAQLLLVHFFKFGFGERRRAKHLGGQLDGGRQILPLGADVHRQHARLAAGRP